MKKKINFLTVFISITILVIITFLIYFISNVKPKKVKYSFENTIENENIINNCIIEKNGSRTAIYFDTIPEIFKEYNYHSYISGDGVGRKIWLQLFLVSEKKDICYKIKSYCYDYSDTNNFKFLGYYYNNFIKKNEKYNLAIYVPETDNMYITNIEIQMGEK